MSKLKIALKLILRLFFAVLCYLGSHCSFTVCLLLENHYNATLNFILSKNITVSFDNPNLVLFQVLHVVFLLFFVVLLIDIGIILQKKIKTY